MQGTAPSNKARRPPKDQFHHAIPRFILRRYQVGPVLSKPERVKAFRLTGVLPEYILVYDLPSRTLQTLPIGQVYGEKNLYRDASDAFNINYLEEKLARLEDRAAQTLKVIHDAIPRGRFTIDRAALGDLRKFLFLMHYRQGALSSSYFDKDHPENILVRQRFERYGQTKGLHTPIDIWLHFLRYYLKTPHEKINNDGLAWLTGHSAEERHRLIALEDVTNADYWEAVAYQNQSHLYFLGVWEAADEDEFVLTTNAFNLWEGFLTFDTEFHLHRIFVVSPRLAIVLRRNELRPEVAERDLRPHVYSSLADLPLKPPTTSHIMPRSWTVEQRQEHRLSARGQRDTFKFEINKLTSAQTLAVNAVVLDNARQEGSLTFSSKSLMVRTLRLYLSGRPRVQNKDSLVALFTQLLSRPTSKPHAPQVVHELFFEWLMTLVLQSMLPTPPRSPYMCGVAVVHHMAQLSSNDEAQSTIFAQDYSRYAESLIAYIAGLASAVPEVAPLESRPASRPGELDCDASAQLLISARPLLQKAVPSCVCSTKSSVADQILEAAVVVRLLNVVVQDAQLRTSLQSSYPAFVSFLYM